MTVIAVLACGAAIAFVLCSIPWTARRFARFDALPAHYGWRGKPTRMGSPALIVWQLPLFDVVLLLGIAGVFVFVPREYQNGHPGTGMILASAVVAASHGFILWLTDRWARNQA